MGRAASHDWTIVAAGGPNTTALDLTVSDDSGATVTFAEVTGSGTTSVDVLTILTAGATPELPLGYFAAGALYYDVNTTATFVGDVTVCLPYDDLTDAHILHFDDGQWIDVTLELEGDLVCGVVSSLSPFAVVEVSAEVAPNTTIVQAPADPTIQDTADGANVQFQFTSTIDSVEQPAEFECTLDGEEWSSCDTPFAFNCALRPAHASRPRGQRDTTSATSRPPSTRGPSSQRPVATIDGGPDDEDPVEPGIQNDGSSATFTFSSDQPGSTFECRLTSETTGDTWESCDSGKTYNNLATDNEYTFEVQATNPAGHVELPARRVRVGGRRLHRPGGHDRLRDRRARSTRPPPGSPSRPMSRSCSNARSTARPSESASPASSTPASASALTPSPSAPRISPTARTSATRWSAPGPSPT